MLQRKARLCQDNAGHRQLYRSRAGGSELSTDSTLQSQKSQKALMRTATVILADLRERAMKRQQQQQRKKKRARREFNVKLADSTVSSVKWSHLPEALLPIHTFPCIHKLQVCSCEAIEFHDCTFAACEFFRRHFHPANICGERCSVYCLSLREASYRLPVLIRASLLDHSKNT